MVVTIKKDLNFNEYFIRDLARNSSQIFKTDVHFVFVLRKITQLIEDNLLDCDLVLYIQSKDFSKFEFKQITTLGFRNYREIATTIINQDQSNFQPLNPNELKCILFPDGEDSKEKRILLFSTY